MDAGWERTLAGVCCSGVAQWQSALTACGRGDGRFDSAPLVPRLLFVCGYFLDAGCEAW